MSEQPRRPRQDAQVNAPKAEHDGPLDPQRRLFLRQALIAAGGSAALSMGLAPTEALAESAAEYQRAREHVRAFQQHNGIFRLDYYLNKSKEIVDIGKYNTESGGEWIEEGGILDVLEQLGMKNFTQFAEAFNGKFSTRDSNAKQQLIDNAAYVDEKMAAGIDIKKSDKAFHNVRLAVQIWVTNDHLKFKVGEKLALAGKTFNVRDIKRILPALDVQELLFYPQEAEQLELLLKFLPKEAPAFQKGKLTLDVVKRLVPKYAYKTEKEENGEKTTERGLLIRHFFDEHSLLAEAFKKTPHGAFGAEVVAFFSGEPPYDKDTNGAEAFTMEGEGLDEEEKFKKFGFDPGSYDMSGP